MDWLLATNEAHACHQVLEARGSPAEAGPESSTAVPNSALYSIDVSWLVIIEPREMLKNLT